MAAPDRRELLADTAKGMLLASLGWGFRQELGLSPAWAGEEPGRLTFGPLEPLVDFVAQTPPEKIIAESVAKIRSGVSTRDLVAATALANARAFGGEDYVGFHTLMALAPAWSMAQEEGNDPRSSLAVLKVLHRNAQRLKERGPSPDTLAPVKIETPPPGAVAGKGLRDAARDKDLQGAEKRFAELAGKGTGHALDALMEMVEDGAEVHRTVLVAKSLELAGFVGTGHAHTLLRQSVHYCVKNEASPSYIGQWGELRSLIPVLLDELELKSWSPGKRRMDAAWIRTASNSFLSGSPASAPAAIAFALKEGVHPEDIGEAIALGSNHLVLRDPGRKGREVQPGKPEGSVHGDSVGVHSGDSTHAWRAIARSGSPRTQVISLMLAAYQLARDRAYRGAEILTAEPVYAGAMLEAARKVPAERLVAELDAAVGAGDQNMAAALVVRLGETGAGADEPKRILRKWATTEDGALHAEKYYRTACDDFQTTRPELRWNHLAGLARVTASASAARVKAPGLEEATALLRG